MNYTFPYGTYLFRGLKSFIDDNSWFIISNNDYKGYFFYFESNFCTSTSLNGNKTYENNVATIKILNPNINSTNFILNKVDYEFEINTGPPKFVEDFKTITVALNDFTVY